MPTPKERLSHLLELAASGAGEHAALANEVADLLLDWPAEYPVGMRAPFETLLEKIAREMDATDRAALARRFEGCPSATIALLNEFFLEAAPAMKEEILARGEALPVHAVPSADSNALLIASRTAPSLAPPLAAITGVPEVIAQAAMHDAHVLATLAKGAGINRATFSAVAILAGPARSVRGNFQILALFDRVPENGARHLVQFWRSRCDNGATAQPVERAA